MDTFPISPIRQSSGTSIVFHEDQWTHQTDEITHISSSHSVDYLQNHSPLRDYQVTNPLNQQLTSVPHSPTVDQLLYSHPINESMHPQVAFSSSFEQELAFFGCVQSSTDDLPLTLTHNDQTSTFHQSESTQRQVRQSVKQASRRKQNIACSTCYVAKTSCDGGRPCSRCVRLDKICTDRSSKFVSNPSVNLLYDRLIHQPAVPAIVHAHIPQVAYMTTPVPIAQPINHSSTNQSRQQFCNQSPLHFSVSQSPSSFDSDSDSAKDQIHAEPVNQSTSHCDSDSDDEYDPRTYNLLNPRFHKLISQTMCDVQLTWFTEQASNQIVNNQTLDPFQINGLFGKLVYWNWMSLIMTPTDFARVFHDTCSINNEHPQTLALIEMAQLKAIKQTIDESNELASDTSLSQQINESWILAKAAYNSTQTFTQSTNQSSKQSTHVSINHSIDQSINQSGESTESINHACSQPSCNQTCHVFHEWFESNPCLIMYIDSPEEAISQSINQSINRLKSPLSNFDYPCIVETLENIDELSSESTWRKVLDNTFNSSSPSALNQSLRQLITVRLSLTVNTAFERLFGYSQSDMRTLSLQHSVKAQIALVRPDYWSDVLTKEQDASFARISEYMLSIACISKWGSNIYCLRHTKYVCDELGRYKEFVSLFIPLDQPCPPYRKPGQSRKTKDKKTKRT